MAEHIGTASHSNDDTPSMNIEMGPTGTAEGNGAKETDHVIAGDAVDSVQENHVDKEVDIETTL